jgi:2-polyprenyl-6-methoxyphenol hydroxylase-like FAD-dependent oxidoreductase
MTPNMGQGACTALEDAVVLARSMEAFGPTPEALRVYERRRKARTGWIVRQSRRIGRIAQLSNPVAVAGRDRIMRALPKTLVEQVQRRVHTVSFNGKGSVR